ncbi:MAG: fibronectin type III domain-containing protein [Acidobacteria bacterium]|nr:MAG: fibronectin type III domain-containing protein [Acidobacteriota bacterium]
MPAHATLAGVGSDARPSPDEQRRAFLQRSLLAEAVVELTVLDRAPQTEPGRDSAGAAVTIPRTRLRARVDEALGAGPLRRGEEIDLLLPGGLLTLPRDADGSARRDAPPRTVGAWVPASPQLRPGDRAVVLLDRWHGAWTPLDLRAGVLRIDAEAGLAVVDPPSRLDSEPARPVEVAAFPLDPLRRDLAARLAGPAVDSDPGVQSATAAFALTLSPDALPPFGCGDGGGNPIRWFEFERGQQVEVLARSGGQIGVPNGGLSQVEAAIGAWNNDAQSDVRLVYGGETELTLAIAGLDGRNSIAFEDPGDQIPGSYPQRVLIALTVVFFDCERLLSFAGGLAHPIVEFGIVTQDGVGSFFFGNQANPLSALGEVLGHEMGHGLGFAHPCSGTAADPCVGPENSALMRPILQGDRGAVLGSDDRAALAALYRAPVGPPPAAPSNLRLTASTTSSLSFEWNDESSGELGFEIESRSLAEPWEPLISAPAGATTATVNGLDAEPRLFRVRARSTGGLSAPSNQIAATPRFDIAPCVQDEHTLCLNRGRFLVRSSFSMPAPGGAAEPGEPASGELLTEDTGTFWFFSPSNVELVLKVVDACVPFGGYWVFGGALTDVETSILVVDTTSGETRTYFNPAATPFQPIQDTAAFSSCL